MFSKEQLNRIIREHNLFPSKNKRLLLTLLAKELFEGNHPIPVSKVIPSKGKQKYVLNDCLDLFMRSGICTVKDGLIWLADDVISALRECGQNGKIKCFEIE